MSNYHNPESFDIASTFAVGDEVIYDSERETLHGLVVGKTTDTVICKFAHYPNTFYHITKSDLRNLRKEA